MDMQGAFNRHRPTADEMGLQLVEEVAKNHLEYDEALCRRLIAEGASLDVTSKHGRKALIQASMCGRLGLVQQMVEKNANVNMQDSYGCTPLSMSMGSFEVTEYLLGKGAKLRENDVNKWSELMSASDRFGGEKTAALLIAHGANVNFRDSEGMTPLLKSSFSGYPKTVRILLENGANPNAQNEKGETPLMKSLSGGYHNITAYLLHHGADPLIQDKEGKNALDHCFEYNARQRELMEKTMNVRLKRMTGDGTRVPTAKLKKMVIKRKPGV